MDLWHLDPTKVYLNHGAYGACPKVVLAAQERWRIRMERQPSQFFARDVWEGLIGEALAPLASFVGARAEDLVFVENATVGTNSVLRSLRFEEGDELLTTTHAYGAVRSSLSFVAQRWGASVVATKIPFPCESEDEIVEAVLRGFSERTRLLVIDHIASDSALVFPVKRLAKEAKKRGVMVLVDGAHAPGHIPLDIPSFGVDWYTGNAHKWLYAPKGCAFLWTAPKWQAETHPLATSFGRLWDAGYQAEFLWQGTRDLSAWLSVVNALQFHKEMGGGRLMERNRTVAWEGAKELALAWEVPLPAPKEIFGSMVSIPIPWEGIDSDETRREKVRELWETKGIEIALTLCEGKGWARVSVAPYNDIGDFEQLALCG
ncbi:aminotransferase class V-fold PLP-dependent enzyme [bacterium]|nr:aminotransferase class V-fold PLP-dependent enzyme [bacterium]